MSATSIDCPSCGHTFMHTSGVHVPQSGLTNPLAASGLSDLQDRVRSLDTLISRLNQDRVNLLRKINTIRDKTSYLPSEILSHIFQLAHPPIDFRNHLPPWISNWETECRYHRRDTYHREEDQHFKLASVSHRWRQIIFSTPQLWTTISLGVWKSSIGSHISLLDLYDQLAGDLSISIELDFRYHAVRWMRERDRGAREASLTLLEPIFEAVFTRLAPKIHHLTLISPPSEILFNVDNHFFLCSSLTIHGVAVPSGGTQQVPVDTHSLANAARLPRLQRVFLHFFNLPLDLPWLSITILDLELISTRVAFDMLTKCLNLVKLRSPTRLFPSDLSIAEPVKHDNLESIICSDDVDFYRHFQFTKLQSLHWSYINHAYDKRDLRLQIFSKLPPTLVSLTLAQIQCPDNMEFHLQDLFIRIPQLLELRLLKADGRAMESTIRSIGRPSRSTIGGPAILPKLRRLSILVRTRIDSQMVVDMLEALYAVRTGEEGFHLEVFEIDWREEDSRRLQALVSSGFSVRITTDVEIPEPYAREFSWW